MTDKISDRVNTLSLIQRTYPKLIFGFKIIFSGGQLR
jgi:hypothetical protein